MSTSTLHTVETGRARIDEIDAEIVRLVHERTTVSAQIQRARLADGGRRWPTPVRTRWSAAGARPSAGPAARSRSPCSSSGAAG